MKKFLFSAAAILSVSFSALSGVTADPPKIKTMEVTSDGTFRPLDFPSQGWHVARTSEGSSSSGGSSSGGSSEEENMFIVKCSYKWNPSCWMLEYMTAYNADNIIDGEYHPYDYTQGPMPVPVDYVEVEVPAGVYDFVGQFAHINDKYRYGSDYEAFVFKENVVVEGDMELVFDPNEAINEIKVVTYNPDGQESRLPRGKQVTEDQYSVEEPGNINMITIQTQVHHDIYGQVLGRITEVTGDVVSGDFGITDGMAQNNFHVNNVSDKYTFRQLRIMPASPSKDGVYIAPVWQRGSAPGTITNDASSYVNCGQNFVTSPLGEANPVGDNVDYSLYAPAVWNGSQSAMAIGIGGAYPEILNAYCSNAKVSGEDVEPMYCIQARFTDAIVIPEGSSDAKVYTNIGGVVYPFGGEEASYYFFPIGQLRFWPEGTLFPLNPFPGDKAFISPLNGTDIVNGSTAPFMVSYLTEIWSTYGGYGVPYFYNHYLGSLGEERKSDAEGLVTRLYADNELIGEGPDALMDWSFFYSPEQNAVMKVEYDNTNFCVGQVTGGNKAEVVFDLNNEDHFPPSVTMLQLRDAQGCPAQMFANSADASIVLSAADLDNIFGTANSWGAKPSWNECSVPHKLVVEVSPYAENIWETIEMTEETSMFYSHGFGAFYSGSLASLNKKGYSGWFDLRITVEDQAGNYQKQTVSAAFNIADLASIDKIKGDAPFTISRTGDTVTIGGADVSVCSLYDMSGRQVIVSESGIVDMNCLNDGVYILNISGPSGHKTIKMVK